MIGAKNNGGLPVKIFLRDNKNMVMRFLFYAMVVLLPLSGIVHGRTGLEAEPTIEQLLIDANSKKALAAREITQSPDRIAGEVARIIARLDSFFRDELRGQFDTHYKEIEQSLQTVSLPEDVGRLEVAWEQLKAGTRIDSSGLDALVEDFIGRAQAEIEPYQANLIASIDSQLEEIWAAAFKQAQDTIRAPFLEILVRHFPAWDTPHLTAPPLSVPSQSSAEDYRPNVVRPALGLTGILLIVLRRKIVRMVSLKMAGKVAGKFIPVVGALLLAFDVWDAAQAKTSLEQTLREQFLIRYQEEFTLTTLWDQPAEEGEPSTRQQLEQEIRPFLHRWSDHCRREVERILEAAHIFAISPNVKDYITEQTQKGRHTQEIVEDLSLVSGVFGQEIIVQAPLDDLLLLIVHAPDEQELARLARELGPWLLQEYAQHGREVLVTANRLGVPTFLEVVRTGKKLDWYDVRTVFEQYSRLSEPARRGLVLALLERTSPSSIPSATLENISRHEKLFRIVAPLVAPDTDKLFNLFGSPPVLDVVDRAYQRNTEAAEAFLSQWTFRIWERYRDPARFDALSAVTDYRLTERKQMARDLAREIGERDELTPIFADVGLCGVRLWDTYVGPAAGQHQRKVTENAIYLHKEGYPCDVLQTEEGLSRVRFFHHLPLGLQAFHLLRQEGKKIGSIVVLFIVLIPVFWFCWRISYKRENKRHRRSSPVT